MTMNATEDQAPAFVLETEPPATPRQYYTQEVKLMVVRDCATEALPVANKPELAVEYYHQTITKADWYDPEKECFVVIALNRRNRIRAYNLVSLGGMTSTVSHPREVFRAAIVMGACAIICLHNHPGGDPAPSSADVLMTRQLREAAKIVSIELLDHIIIGDAKEDPNGRGFYSFREAGLL